MFRVFPNNSILIKLSIPLVTIIAFYLLVFYFTPVNGFQILLFVIFNVFLVYLPAGILFSILFKKDNFRPYFCLLGLPIILSLFVIFSVISTFFNYYFDLIIYSIIIMYGFFKFGNINKKISFENPGSLFLIFSSLLVVVLTIQFFTFILPSLPPTKDSLALIYQDSAWTIGNTWSLIHFGYPLRDIRLSGAKLGYHILQNIYQATCFKFTKIDPLYIHLYLEPLFNTINILAIGIWGAKYFLKVNTFPIFVFVFGLVFSSSFGSNSTGFNLEIFANPLSFVFGLPYFLLFFFLILSDLKGIYKISIIYLVTCFICASLTKGIFLFLFPLTLFFFICYNLFVNKRIIKTQIWGLITIIASAVIIKLFFFSTSQQAISLRFLNLTLDELFTQNFQPINWSYFISVIKHFILILIPYIYWWPALSVFTLLFYKNKESKNAAIFILLFIAISMAIVTFVYFPGGDIYFFWYSLIACLFAALIFLDNLNLTPISRLLIILILILATINPIKSLLDWHSLGWGDFGAKRKIWDQRATINKDEWMAMEWVKQHTPFDALFISDRSIFNHEKKGDERSRFFCYSMITGRQFYIEGSDFISGTKNQKLTQTHRKISNLISNPTSEKDIYSGLEQSNADFIIVSKRFNKIDYSVIKTLSSVYNTPSISIFKIEK